MPENVYWLDEKACAIGCNENVLNMFGFKTMAEFEGCLLKKWAKFANGIQE